MSIRLAHFIRAELEPILQAWEAFARTIHSTQHMGKSGLRDHARQMLLAIADDLDGEQSDAEQEAKSKGRKPTDGQKSSAEVHGADRHDSGFSVMDTVSEFRALRASVVSLWSKAQPTITGELLEDLTRFHEAIDQAVAESLDHYATAKEMETRLFGAVLLASPDPIYVLDLEGRFLYANNATADLFALAAEAIIGRTTGDLGFAYAADFQRHLDKVLADQCTYRGQFTYTFASGEGDHFEYMLAPVLDEDGNTEAAVCIIRDVTQQALAVEKAWHHAHHDPLTGLPNRRLFMDRLEQQMRHSRRSGLPLTVLFMDLDGFKQVNDSLGHEAGDRVLTEVARRLADRVRDDDTVARLGGDEFAIVLADATQPEGAQRVAQTIVDAHALPFAIGDQAVQVAISIGIAFYPDDAASSDALLKAADRAMYQAKTSGANRIRVFDEDVADQRQLA